MGSNDMNDPDIRGQELREELWARRWLSHIAAMLTVIGYVAGSFYWPDRVPPEVLWPLIIWTIAYYGPAFVEAVTDAVSAVRGGRR